MQLERYVRWMPVLGVVLPNLGGRWFFPSVFVGWEHGLGLTTEGFIARVRESLALIGRPLGALEGEALRDALLREGGVVHGVFQRCVDELIAKGPPKRFLVNSDGECVEFHEVTVSLEMQVRAVTTALSSAGDFIRVGDQSWELVDRTRTSATPEGESLGQFERERSRWIVSGNSAGRVERMLDRLEALLGTRPKALSRKVTAPWKTDGNVVRTKAEADQTLVLASGPVSASAPIVGASPGEAQLALLRRQLDEPIEVLGGVPRQRARTPEGRDAVEQWLRKMERYGRPPQEGESRLLDLDPVRRELGLPTVL